jgi:hypothetical protein
MPPTEGMSNEQLLHRIKVLEEECSKMQQRVQRVIQMARIFMPRTDFIRFLKRVEEDDFSSLYQTIKENR